MSGDDTPFLPRAATPSTSRPAPAWAKKTPPPAITRTATAKAGKYLAPRDPHQHARKIAETVTDTWYRNFGGSRIDIPLGTVASLALLRQPKGTGAGLANWILDREPAELPKLYREIWLSCWHQRPDLIDRALRLHDWAWNNDPPTHELTAVHAVTHRAINTGLLDLAGHDDPYWRAQTDLLSPLLTELRHTGDKKWRGEYHTPPGVTDMMANVLVDEHFADSNRFICDPAVGSGGMLRSVAQRLRELNRDPHDYRWYGNDIDALAAACAAVNAILWDLGPHTVIGCSNALTTEDAGLSDAIDDARDSIEQRNKAVQAASTIAAHRATLRLLDDLTNEKATA